MRFGTIVVAGFGLLSLTSGSAFAGPAVTDQRYTTLLEEHLDGAKQASSSAELALVKLLMDAGIHFVDEAQSRKIRSVTDAGTLMAGEVSPVITSLDADVILAGICHLTEIKSDLLGGGAHRYDAMIEAKTVSVDTGRILGAFSVRGEGMDFTPRQAAQKAAAQAADKLSKEVLDAARKAASAPNTVEVTVTGIVNVTASEEVVQAVKRVDGVKDVRVAQAGRGATKLLVDLQGKKARDLALALDGGSSGLTVWGYSDRAIKAEYAPETAMAVPLVISSFDGAKAKKRDAWRAEGVAEMVATSLSNAAYLRLPAGTDAQSLGDKPASWTAALKKLGVDAGTAVVLAGSHESAGENVALTARVVAASSGAVLLAKTASCPEDSLATCAATLGDELRDGLLQAILTKRSLFKGDLALPKAVPTGREAKPLAIQKVEVENVFPARLAAYKERPVGKALVKNRGDEPLSGITLTVDLPGFMKASLDHDAGQLGPGEEAEIPIRVVLDPEALRKQDDNQPAVLQMRFSYDVGDMRVEESRSQALLVYDRNALTWDEAESAAAFVDARSETAKAIAKVAAEARESAKASGPLAQAVSIFAAASTLPLRYAPDPVNPYGDAALDYVQFPDQAAASGTGDCDDLAVLFSAASEAAGRRALLVTTPEHVFVAAATGVAEGLYEEISLDRGRLLFHAGEAWIPLETTLLGKPFSEAWDAAAKELARWKNEPDKIGVIDVRQAWRSFPPVDLVDGAKAPALGSAADVAKRVAEEHAALEKRRTDALADALRKVEEAIAKKPSGAGLNDKGRLLVLSGRLDEALVVFGEAAGHADAASRASNNAGNVHVMAARHAEALQAYEKASKAKGADGRVHVNAALAAFLMGDEGAFGEHLVFALEMGAEDAVARLSHMGVAPGGTRSADAERRASRDLGEAVRKALEKKKKSVKGLADPGGSGTRARDASEAATPLEGALYWL